jgi:hypothetical protein
MMRRALRGAVKIIAAAAPDPGSLNFSQLARPMAPSS